MALVSGATNYYTYFTCQAACSTNYFALANGTCSLATGSYCAATAALIKVGEKSGIEVYRCPDHNCKTATNLGTSISLDVNGNVIASSSRKLVCYDTTRAPLCPLNKIAVQMTETHLEEFGICEDVIASNVYTEATHSGLYVPSSSCTPVAIGGVAGKSIVYPD